MEFRLVIGTYGQTEHLSTNYTCMDILEASHSLKPSTKLKIIGHFTKNQNQPFVFTDLQLKLSQLAIPLESIKWNCSYASNIFIRIVTIYTKTDMSQIYR